MATAAARRAARSADRLPEQAAAAPRPGGVAESLPGARGGFRLAKKPEDDHADGRRRGRGGPDEPASGVRKSASGAWAQGLPRSAFDAPCAVHADDVARRDGLASRARRSERSLTCAPTPTNTRRPQRSVVRRAVRSRTRPQRARPAGQSRQAPTQKENLDVKCPDFRWRFRRGVGGRGCGPHPRARPGRRAAGVRVTLVDAGDDMVIRPRLYEADPQRMRVSPGSGARSRSGCAGSLRP